MKLNKFLKGLNKIKDCERSAEIIYDDRDAELMCGTLESFNTMSFEERNQMLNWEFDFDYMKGCWIIKVLKG